MSSPELYGHGSFGFDKTSERNSERVDQPFTSQTLESSRFGNTVFESAGCENSMLGSPIVEAPVIEVQSFETPLFEAAGWSQLDGHAWEAGSDDRQVDVSYINAGTCPDCGNGMIRLGLCMTCPCCGYGSCGE